MRLKIKWEIYFLLAKNNKNKENSEFNLEITFLISFGLCRVGSCIF